MRLIGFILRHKVMAIGLLFVAVLVLNYFLVTIPNAQATTYRARISPGIANAKQLFSEIAATTDSALFNDPDIPTEEKRQLLARAANLNQQALLVLEHLKKDADSLNLPLSSLTGEHSEAIRTKNKLMPVIAQSQDVVSEYAALVDFLQKYYEVPVGTEQHAPSSELATSGARAYLQNSSKQLLATRVPADIKGIQTKAANVLSQMASSGQTSSEAKINLDYELFAIIANDSVTVYNAKELPEKLDSNDL